MFESRLRAAFWIQSITDVFVLFRQMRYTLSGNRAFVKIKKRREIF